MTDLLTVPASQYHADKIADQPSLSSSVAHVLLTRSPAHAWTCHPRLNPDYEQEESATFDLGRTVHSLLLEGDGSNIVVVDADDWRTKAAKEQRDLARADGKTPLLARQYEQAMDMLEAVGEQILRLKVDPPVFQAGKAEQTLVWDEQGVTCRARVDWLRDDHRTIDDFKTTAKSANPAVWSRGIFALGYDVQAAFYLRGLRAVTGADAEFRFVVAETTPPYAVSVVALAPSALALANEKVDHAIRLWRRCLETNEWPSYPNAVAYAELPAYEEMRWLERHDLEEAA